jgi:NAD(P)-dependent dehydrogenase (short-subunit alcohol dehydrogenase family)
MTADASRFAGKAAIVTGAASGIGLATATRLSQDGAAVVLADFNVDAARRAAEQLRVGGFDKAVHFACDVSQEADVVAAVDFAIAHFGRLDIVVNNAGVMIFKTLEDHTEEDMRRVMQVDFLGAFFFLKQAFIKCRAGCAIVNVSSIHAEETTPLVTAYAAAKAALLSLTRSAAIEGGPKGIRVNAILPGAIETPMLRENPNVKSGAETLDAAAIGRPEDVAAAIAYLVSDDAQFVQGAAIRVDGGRLDRL